MYDAIKRLLKMLKKSKDSCDSLMGLLGLRKFLPSDIKFFEEYLQVYCHFANVLDILQGEKNCYVGALLPLLTGLSAKLEEEARKVQTCGPLAQALIRGINTRFWSEFHNDTLFVASGVHPRFKVTWIKDPVRRAEVWELVRAELHELQRPNEGTASSTGHEASQ